MKFKEWLKINEVGTATNSIAVVPMMLGNSSLIKRKRLDPIIIGGRIKDVRKNQNELQYLC